MRHWIIGIFLTAALILAGMASLYGVLFTDDIPVSVGPMQLAAFPNGLALYQRYEPFYYSFSPYNDYLILSGTVRNSLITAKELEEKSFTTDLHSSRWGDIKSVFWGHFNKERPGINFFSRNNQIRYRSSVSKNRLTIYLFLQSSNGKVPQRLGASMTFYKTDFVYDKSGRLYTSPAREDRELFEKLYGIRLSPLVRESSFSAQIEEARILIPDKTVIVVNPSLASAIVVRADSEQILSVTPGKGLIEVEGAPPKEGDGYTAIFRAEIYDTPMEAQKFL